MLNEDGDTVITSTLNESMEQSSTKDLNQYEIYPKQILYLLVAEVACFNKYYIFNYNKIKWASFPAIKSWIKDFRKQNNYMFL